MPLGNACFRKLTTSFSRTPQGVTLPRCLRLIAAAVVDFTTQKKRNFFVVKFLFCLIVRLIGLEPTRLSTPDPKSGASTNFATGAGVH